ncbi:c-type cytochrome [Bdellovibrio reynosensis]|uniref:Cytochrome c domain-containing protein n=1 Tax=Bdellovibrio reynosensis TaxID=2835041 RepID=A0ABY4CC90_9BACT|nr:cytochrome c [Bdellovibrio reynosensis]UOF02562.1 hypothetical protein MNR06_06300 [Bdellovibrio reynosensis]
MPDVGQKLVSLKWKASFKQGLYILIYLLVAIAWIAFDGHALTIESEESKTADLKPVFNKITWQWGKDQDVWMMNQSHHGANADPTQWDRLAIFIDKTKNPKVARFYQLKPGDLKWSDNLIEQRVEYRANCFICHNNGPRAIRPFAESQDAALTWRERIKIHTWNLRMKAYGRIVYDRTHDQEDAHLTVPFSYHSREDNTFLKVKTCVRCHNESGSFARGFLRRQHIGTIRALIQKGHMPPLGFSLDQKEKRQLEDFIRGF